MAIDSKKPQEPQTPRAFHIDFLLPDTPEDIINIDTWIISFLERPSKGRIFYTKKSVAISQRKGLIPCQHEANTLDSPTVMVLSVTWERNVKTLTPSIPRQTSTEIGPRPYAMLIPG